MSIGEQEVQTFNYKINKSWGYNVQHGEYIQWYFINSMLNMITRIIAVNILQYIQMSHIYVVHMKVIKLYVSYKSMKKLKSL